MVRRNSIILENKREFISQNDAISFFKNILDSGSSKITKENKDFSDLISLYKRHPEFIEKSKREDNIDYFLIKNSGEFNTKCFHAVHIDGTQTDWAYRKAITAKKDTNFQSFVDGARHNLEIEILNFRDSNFTSVCRKFLALKEFSETNIPETWFSAPANSQYRASLLEPIKSEFINWYKSQI